MQILSIELSSSILSCRQLIEVAISYHSLISHHFWMLNFCEFSTGEEKVKFNDHSKAGGLLPFDERKRLSLMAKLSRQLL